MFYLCHSGMACTPSGGGGLGLVRCSTVQILGQEHMALCDQGIVVVDEGAQYGRGYGDDPVISQCLISKRLAKFMH